MKIYLDTSVYNRPFDDQTQVKIFLETQASISIFHLISQELVQLIGSPVLELENQRNTLPIRRQFVAAYLRKASIYQPLNFEIEERAKQLRSQGLKNFDALHVATAEFTNADFFLTCDKRLINGCKSLTMKVRNPVEFILEITDEDP